MKCVVPAGCHASARSNDVEVCSAGRQASRSQRGVKGLLCRAECYTLPNQCGVKELWCVTLGVMHHGVSEESRGV